MYSVLLFNILMYTKKRKLKRKKGKQQQKQYLKETKFYKFKKIIQLRQVHNLMRQKLVLVWRLMKGTI